MTEERLEQGRIQLNLLRILKSLSRDQVIVSIAASINISIIDQDHTISVYDNKSRVIKNKTQTNSVTNATHIAKLRNKLSKER